MTEPFGPILVTTDSERLALSSLVLSAVGINHDSRQRPSGEWELLVAEEDIPRARQEIAIFELENSDWPPPEPASDRFVPLFRAQSLLIVGLLAALYGVTGPWSQGSPWFAAGAADSGAILDHHQYYRLVTALTLHAGPVHLLGNCLIGGVILHFYFHRLGNGMGICALLLASATAGMINAASHGPGHLSVGFSTAVFAAIGILCGLTWRSHHLQRPGDLFMPLMAGMALLAMLGSSGVHTDFGAHIFGLLTGLITGILLGGERSLALRYHLGLQTLLTIAGLLVPVLCWYLALR